MTRTVDTIEEARALADELRPVAPAQANAIEAAIRRAEAEGRKDGLAIQVGIRYKLEKFDGDYEPGKNPVEVIEGEG